MARSVNTLQDRQQMYGAGLWFLFVVIPVLVVVFAPLLAIEWQAGVLPPLSPGGSRKGCGSYCFSL